MPIVIVFSASIFLSAFLLFMVQPMAGKMLMPLVGGSPSGWVVALAFFQTSLLVGYVIAHFLSKTKPRVHGFAVIALLVLGGVFLPLAFDSEIVMQDGAPVPLQVFILLTSAIFVPFIALSSVSSTVQRLFVHTDHARRDNPYFLYAISNCGSFLGLLGYPFLFEPLLVVTAQTSYWAYAYGGLIVLLVGAASMTRGTEKKTKAKKAAPVPAKSALYWTVLSFISSGLLVAVTNYITIDIAPMPMFWAIPLALYLATFIFAFATDSTKVLHAVNRIHPVIVISGIAFYVFLAFISSVLMMVAHVLFFTMIALFCHLNLAAHKPKAENLTAFYLYIALGGALGGLANAFIVPYAFNALIEYPLIALASLALSPLLFNAPEDDDVAETLTVIGFGALLLMAGAAAYIGWDPDKEATFAMASILAVMCCGIALIANRPKHAIALSVLMLAWFVYSEHKRDVIHADRNFFGTLAVFEQEVEHNEETHTVRVFKHGSTIHGIQLIGEDKPMTGAIGYYRALDDIFTLNDFDIKDVSITGLGAGVMLCFNAPDRRFVSFEIDQDVYDVAKAHFDYIDKCAHPENDFVIGDGRLEFGKYPRSYDVILLDAFSSDAVPTHLLTEEAFEIYTSKLNENGVIAANISNRFFSLARILSKTVQPFGLTVLMKEDLEGQGTAEQAPWHYNYSWLAMTRDTDKVTQLEAKGWTKTDYSDATPVWTDNYTYLLYALKFIQNQNEGQDAKTQ